MTRQASALRRPPALRMLLRQRHWKYATFCTKYDKAAKAVDPELMGSWPSRAQFHRWINGEVRGMPYPDACRVLEALFPGWTAEQLFAPSSDELLARGAAGDREKADALSAQALATAREGGMKPLEAKSIELRAAAGFGEESPAPSPVPPTAKNGAFTCSI